MADALVISGAAAKGAFAAGAMAELLGCGGIKPTRLVGTAGGLNATYASAFPHEPEGLVELWRRRASALHVFTPPHACRGVSGLTRVRRLVDETLPRCGTGVDLRVVVTDLDGVDGEVEGKPATSFERVVAFDAPDFADPRTRCRLVDAATASSALPLVFEPEGPLLDGGVVNNTPLKVAIDASDVDRVFVIAAFPRVFPCRSARDLNHLAEVTLNERLYRDLKEAYSINASLRALARFDIGPAILAALGWSGRRVLEIIEIRPEQALEGSLVAGFFDRRLRERYIEEGRLAARRALDKGTPPAAKVTRIPIAKRAPQSEAFAPTGV